LIIGVPKETVEGETRVALTPGAIKKLLQQGNEILVEAGAGVSSGCDDAAYEAAGAKIASSAKEVYERANLIAKVQPPTLGASGEADQLREGTTLVCLLLPFAHLDVVRRLSERGVISFALDLMPRITRAQSMDVLSSMSTVAGYRAVLWAADRLPKFLPMMMTAAGTIKPARILVLGAGVAGLQAIATAKRLGAIVEAFDIRAVAKEQVESLGGRFIELPNAEDAEGEGGYAKEQTAEQQEALRRLLSERIADADAVICTALVPGRRAPTLLTAEQVSGMRPGSVVVDLAAEQGGNCDLTQAGQTVLHQGVEIYGPTNVASTMPADASAMFARNTATFLAHLLPEGELALNLEDEVVSGPLVTREGQITNEAVRKAAEA